MLAELAGNVAVDTLSSRKYWHFITAGDDVLTLEVACAIRATLCILKVDVFGRRGSRKSILRVISDIADCVEERRRRAGLWSGVVLLADGLVEQHLRVQAAT